MIHLFNNVFLEQDTFVYQGYKNVVISPTYATQDITASPTALTSGTSLENVLDGKTIGEFLKSLMTHGEEKVIIFADNSSFAAIITAWLKSTTNMDQASFDLFIDCYKHKCDVYSRPNDQLIEVTKASWSSAPSFNFSTEDFSPSFEFALASAFYNRDFSKKAKLKTLLSKFIKREYEQQILEARKHIDTYILDSDLQALLGGSGKNLTNYKELPRMAIYKEPFFHEIVSVPSNQSYWPGKVSKLDVSKGTTEDITELCQLTDDVNIAIMNMSVPAGLSGSSNGELFQSRGWAFMQSVRSGTLSDAEYNTALDEMLEENISLIHVPFDLRETILFVFLPYIKSLKKQNSTSVLEKFTLR